MIIDFQTQQTSIKNYIETNFPNVLQELELPAPGAYIDDFLNLDKYKKAVQLFYDFGEYSFSDLSNESNVEDLVMTVYLTFNNDKASALKEKMVKYTACFYEMFNRSGCNFGGIADFGQIESVKMYQAAEADINVKVAEISIRLRTER